jgi:hypothetical protein
LVYFFSYAESRSEKKKDTNMKWGQFAREGKAEGGRRGKREGVGRI